MDSPNKLKTLEETRKFVTMVAKHKGWVLNKDEELVEDVITGLMINFNRYGFFMCPCRDSYGEKGKDKDIMCPCDYCVPDQEEFGQCYCGLYLTDEFFKSGTNPGSIPERRPDELYP